MTLLATTPTAGILLVLTSCYQPDMAETGWYCDAPEGPLEVDNDIVGWGG